MSALRSILSRAPEEVFSDLGTLFLYVLGVGAALVLFSLFVGMAIVIVRGAFGAGDQREHIAEWTEKRKGGDE